MEKYNIDVKPIQLLQSDISTAGFEPGSSLNEIRDVWVINENGDRISQAAAGEQITVVAHARVGGGSWISWRPCLTVKELTGSGKPDRFKNASHEESWVDDTWENTAFKLDGLPGGSTTMPARNMVLVVKLWARGDIHDAWPPEDEWL